MKRILTSALLAIPCFAWCQSPSLDMGFSVMVTNHTGYHDRPVGPNYATRDVAKLNWSKGIYYNRQLTHALHLRCGIQLASMGYKTPKMTQVDMLSTEGTDYSWLPFYPENPASVNELQFVYDHRYLGAPLLLRYEWKGRKLKPFLEGGIVPSFYLNSTITQISNVGRESMVRSDVYYNTFDLVGSFSVGIQYAISPGIHLFTQPTFRYHITGIECGSPVHLYSAGIELGIRKGLK